MIAFLISMLFGFLETFLLTRLVTAVLAGQRGNMMKYLLLKFVTYGIAIALLVFRFFDFYLYCFCGFAAGMPASAVLVYIYRCFMKKK